MSKKTHRKSRSKEQKKVDLLYPITIEQLGSEDDPCFGKLHDPKAVECQNCGDAELCQVYKAQQMHIVRKKVEKKQAFMDLTERENYPEDSKQKYDPREVKKRIRSLLREHKRMPLSQLSATLYSNFSSAGLTEKKAVALIKKTAEKSNKFYIEKEEVIWKT